MFTLNGVACEAVVDPVGQADEEEDGTHGHLGQDLKDWDDDGGDVQDWEKLPEGRRYRRR